LTALGYLAWHKYLPTLAAAFSADALAEHPAIPLGISYFTFKLIHYAVEVSWGTITDRSLARFAAYIFLFPIFTAGPIERFDHFLAEREESWSLDSTLAGLFRIGQGLIKAFVFSRLVAPANHDWIPSAEALVRSLPETSHLELGAYLFFSFLYAYFDFSAYSDIAIGASRLFGLRIMENFNWPILAPNIGEFWRRWHMTLAGWCQAYVYVPIIGHTRKLVLAIYATFLAMGAWHGPSWNWILWGAYHGTGVAVYQSWSRFKRMRGWGPSLPGAASPWRHLGIPLTIAFVSGSYAFSTTVDLGPWSAVRILARVFLIDLPA
jgi:alginate O-acetyltransferase complex protein AlgI